MLDNGYFDAESEPEKQTAVWNAFDYGVLNVVAAQLRAIDWHDPNNVVHIDLAELGMPL